MNGGRTGNARHLWRVAPRRPHAGARAAGPDRLLAARRRGARRAHAMTNVCPASGCHAPRQQQRRQVYHRSRFARASPHAKSSRTRRLQPATRSTTRVRKSRAKLIPARSGNLPSACAPARRRSGSGRAAAPCSEMLRIHKVTVPGRWLHMCSRTRRDTRDAARHPCPGPAANGHRSEIERERAWWHAPPRGSVRRYTHRAPTEMWGCEVRVGARSIR